LVALVFVHQNIRIFGGAQVAVPHDRMCSDDEEFQAAPRGLAGANCFL